MAEGARYRLHRLLQADPDLLAQIRAEAVGTIAMPRSDLELAWREGRRSLAAEWMSVYNEVEDERTRVGN